MRSVLLPVTVQPLFLHWKRQRQRGIPVVVFNTLVPDFKDNITFVGVDNYDASYRVTEELIKAHDGKGE